MSATTNYQHLHVCNSVDSDFGLHSIYLHNDVSGGAASCDDVMRVSTRDVTIADYHAIVSA